jgi:hypothetical protein
MNNKTDSIKYGYLNEEETDNFEPDRNPTKHCPILTGTGINSLCVKNSCAWYDDKNNQCILITIGSKL